MNLLSQSERLKDNKTGHNLQFMFDSLLCLTSFATFFATLEKTNPSKSIT